MTFPKITSAIPSPFRKHIFCVVHLLQVGAAGWPPERPGQLIENPVDEDRTVGGGRRSPSSGFSPLFFAEVELFPLQLTSCPICAAKQTPQTLQHERNDRSPICGKEMVHWLWEGGGTIGGYFGEKENGWMITVEVVNEAVGGWTANLPAVFLRMSEGAMWIWSPRTVALWISMKTWGDDVESKTWVAHVVEIPSIRCGQNLAGRQEGLIKFNCYY